MLKRNKQQYFISHQVCPSPGPGISESTQGTSTGFNKDHKSSPASEEPVPHPHSTIFPESHPERR